MSGAPAGNERPGICGACGGECCLARPGIEAPERFLAAADPVAGLARALRSRDWLLLRHVGVPWVDGRPPAEADRYRTILQGLFPERPVEGYLLFVDEPHRIVTICF